MPPKTGEIEYYDPREMEKEMDRLVAAAVEAAAKGENAEQLQDVMLLSVPGSAKDKLKKKFADALAKRKLRKPVGEGDIPSRAKFARLKSIFTLSARQALARITSLLKTRQDLAAKVRDLGKALASSGVVLDKVSVSEADLGTIAPTATVGKGAQQDKGTGR